MKTDSGQNIALSPENEAVVTRLLRRAPYSEPRVVSYDIDALAPKGQMAYAGNTYV